MRRELLTLSKEMRKIAGITTVLIVLFVVSAFYFSPPVEGYYRSPIFATLDGSAGYLYFHGGVIEILEVGGAGGESRRPLGTYEKLKGSEIRVVFSDPKLGVNRVSVGWFGFDWSKDLAQGWPGGNRCSRG